MGNFEPKKAPFLQYRQIQKPDIVFYKPLIKNLIEVKFEQ